jgi:hypothetical protein
MALVTGVAVWSDVECAAGASALAWVPVGQLVGLTAQASVDGQDSLSVAVPLAHRGAAHLTRGRVVRVVTDDPADYEEWRVSDTEDSTDGRLRAAKCDPIALDLSRALYVARTSTGETTTDLSLIDVTVTEVLDGPVRDALDAAGLTWITTGTVEPTSTIDIDAEYATAQSLVRQAAAAVSCEVQVTRNGTSGYEINVVSRIGASAADVYVRTRRNLLSGKRLLSGSLGGTRVIPRGRDDQSTRTVGYAFWEVTATTTATITVRDPRGTGFPSPFAFADQVNDLYAVQRGVGTVVARRITDSEPSTGGTSILTVGSGHPWTAGDEVYVTELAAREIVRVAESAANSTIIAIPPETEVGDLIVLCAWRDGSDTAPSASVGYTSVTTVGGSGNSLRVSYRRATAAGTVNVTAINATRIIAVVYRGALDVGAVQTNVGSGTGVGITGWAQTGLFGSTATDVTFVGHATATDLATTSPSGRTFVEVSNVVPGLAAYVGPYLASNSGTTTTTYDTSGAWASASCEVRAAYDLTRLWSIADPALLTAQAGVYDRLLDRPTLSGAVAFVDDPYLLDQTGTSTAPYGTMTSDTTSDIVTSTAPDVLRRLQPGDILRRSSDNAVIGTILTCDSATQVTLTANAAITHSGAVRFTRSVPAGIDVGGSLSGFLPVGYFPDVPRGGAWQVLSDSAAIDTDIYSPPFVLPVDPQTPYRLWWWLSIVEYGAMSPDLTAQLVTADSVIFDPFVQPVAVGAPVILTPDLEGSLVRLLFESPVLLDAPQGVRIRVTIPADTRIVFGPRGASPSSWVPTDVETPRACDLWHEGTLWLQTQSIPEGYQLELVDLYGVDADAYPYERLTLGGMVVVDDADLGIRTTQRLVALTRDYLRPGVGSVTLGRRERGLAEYLAAQSTVSVADIALRLSRGLVQQVAVLRASPSVVATSDGITTLDPTPVATVAGALSSAFAGTSSDP